MPAQVKNISQQGKYLALLVKHEGKARLVGVIECNTNQYCPVVWIVFRREELTQPEARQQKFGFRRAWLEYDATYGNALYLMSLGDLIAMRFTKAAPSWLENYVKEFPEVIACYECLEVELEVSLIEELLKNRSKSKRYILEDFLLPHRHFEVGPPRMVVVEEPTRPVNLTGYEEPPQQITSKKSV
jgi:hypothetical protein